MPVVASARSIEDPDGKAFTIVSLIDISGPGREPRLLESRSTLLAVLPDAVDANPEQEVLLGAGDRIILYTDGISDVFDSQRRMLGVAGVQRFVRETATMPLADVKKTPFGTR